MKPTILEQKVKVGAEAQMAKWLLRGDCRGPHGEMAAWVENGRPSFWYPEIGGYSLSTFSFLHGLRRDPDCLREAERVAQWLARVHIEGGYARDGRIYPFDAGIILRGFSDYLAAYPEASERYLPLLRTIRDFLVRCFRERIPCLPIPEFTDHETRWSLKYGPHLIKAAAGLYRYGRQFGDVEACDAAKTCASDILNDWKEGWFWAPQGVPLYVHPHLYALEGLSLFGTDAPLGSGRFMADSLRVLADHQDASGGIQSHWSPRPDSPVYPCRSDVTAQAMRLWLLHGDPRWRTPIDRAEAFLLRNRHESGAVRYEPGSAHENVWATCFAAQALAWNRSDPTPSALL